LDGHEDTLAQVASALNSLLSPSAKSSKEIGFHADRLNEEPGASGPMPARRKNVRYQPARRVRRKGKNS
jgi:hypothetical protein